MAETTDRIPFITSGTFGPPTWTPERGALAPSSARDIDVERLEQQVTELADRLRARLSTLEQRLTKLEPEQPQPVTWHVALDRYDAEVSAALASIGVTVKVAVPSHFRDSTSAATDYPGYIR